MTKTGSLFLILGFLFSASLWAAGPAQKLSACQGELLGRRSDVQRINDLIVMQKGIWTLYAAKKSDQADFLKHRLENQLRLTKLDRPIATHGRDKVYNLTANAYGIFREKLTAFPNLVAYELNEGLGRPLKIPIIVSHLPGALQLRMGYSAQAPELTGEAVQEAIDLYATDGDVFLFNFLIVNANADPKALIRERDVGWVFGNFGAGLYSSVRDFVLFGGASYGLPEVGHLTYQKLEEILLSKISVAKFNWKLALQRLDEDRILATTEHRLGKVQAAALQGRLCVLKTILAGGNIAACEVKGFAL